MSQIKEYINAKNSNNYMKNRNIGLTFIFLVGFALMINMCSAEIQYNSMVKTNIPQNLQFSCQVNYQIPSNSATYNFSLYHENGTVILNNVQTQSQGQGSFNYTTTFMSPGYYKIKQFCYDGSNGNYSNQETILATPNGKALDVSQSILFGLIFLLIAALLYGAIYGLQNAINAEWQIAYICASYLLFFCIFFIGWLFSDGYLWQTPIIASIFWIIWLTLSILFWPFIILLGGYLLKKQAEQLMVDDFKKQGYSHEDSLALAKRKR